jgi:hypothetical protein
MVRAATTAVMSGGPSESTRVHVSFATLSTTFRSRHIIGATREQRLVALVSVVDSQRLRALGAPARPCWAATTAAMPGGPSESTRVRVSFATLSTTFRSRLSMGATREQRLVALVSVVDFQRVLALGAPARPCWAATTAAMPGGPSESTRVRVSFATLSTTA